MAIPVIMQELKKIERSLTDISAALHLSRNEENYAINFLHALFKILDSYHDGMDMNVFIMNALEVCCDFYKADWCGIIVADATSEIWGPAEWYNAIEGPMAQTHIRENEYFEDFPLWVKALKEDRPIIIPKVEKTVSHRHYLRYKARNLVGVPFTFRPTGFIILRNAERYLERPEFLKLIVFGGRLIYQTPVNLMTPQQRKEASEVRLNILGTPSITIMGKTITAQDYKSPKSWKLIVCLALSGHPKTASQLSDVFWPSETYNKSQSERVRSIVHRTREGLSRQSPYDLIVNHNGYCLNPELHITTDAQEMESLWQDAKHCGGIEQKKNILEKAMGLYRGKVYSDYSYEQWLMGYVRYYSDLFLKIADAYMTLLWEENQCITIQDKMVKAIRIEKDTILYKWLILALYKNGNPAAAQERYAEAGEVLSPNEFDKLTLEFKEKYDR